MLSTLRVIKRGNKQISNLATIHEQMACEAIDALRQKLRVSKDAYNIIESAVNYW